MYYYNEYILLAIAESCGKPVKVDDNINQVIRGKFSRVCVEVDLKNILAAQFELEGAE